MNKPVPWTQTDVNKQENDQHKQGHHTKSIMLFIAF